ncbi:AAA family ATPase [Methylorubrum suomiense]
MTAPGLLIAAPRSGSGKTTVTLALMRALRRRGVAVRGAKCGPDYIDPAFHEAATGHPSLNLDSFAMPDGLLDACAGLSARDAALVIAEGSMGLHDGIVAGEGRTGANADIAARYGWPVLLVLDVSGAAQSAAAVALGCAAYDPRIRVAGVVLNKVASPRHRRLVEAGLSRIGMRVLGAFPARPVSSCPSVTWASSRPARPPIWRHAWTASGIWRKPPSTSTPSSPPPVGRRSRAEAPSPPPAQRVAVARDAAFSFLYPHMLAGWRAAGAEIVPFSPLADEAPDPSCDACWLPGGYPELHAGRLAAANTFRDGLNRFAHTRPVHGECGGYMVLGESLEDADGVTHPMTGLLPVATSYGKRRLHLGYRVARLVETGLLGAAGTRLVGHEFHYASELTPAPDADNALARVTDAEGTPWALQATAGAS